MVVAAQQVQQQQQPPPPQTSPEEEILKRNTDCVYFLASPLTCKKGSECEYRHSEYARVNPRDCFYWLNGNCLNPKCGFRHPPLDGLLGTQTVASTAASFPSSHSATTTTQAPQSSGKQAVPCIFFQKGLCLKGDRCAFLHGPTPTVNKIPQLAANAPVNEPPPAKKTPGVLQKCTQEQKVLQTNVSKAVAVPPQVYKPALKTETALPRNGLGIQRDAPLPSAAVDEFPRYKVTSTTSVVNGGSLSRPNRQVYASENLGIQTQTGKETDEYLRESSPGFDVLVDDDLGESEYYHGEDQYGRTRGHEGMNMNSNEYDVGGSVDYNSVGDIDRDVMRDSRGYDSYDRMQGQYGWEKHRLVERKGGYPRADSPDRIAESDLRYRLSKNRRGNNGLRSVVSPDYASEKLVDERSRRASRRDSHHVSSHESSLGGRLRGRIKLPSRSPVSGNDIRPERESDRGRNRGQLSPNNTQISHQGNLRDRIKGRTDDDYNNFRGSRIRRETMDDRNFAGPKSLAELKSGKNAENKEQQILGKRKTAEYNQQSESDLAFDGPMPLSEILKRKREAQECASNSKTSSNNQRESSNNNNGAATTAVQSAVTSVAKDWEANNEEQSKPTKAEEKNEPLQLPNGSEHEGEDGMIGDETMEDHELDADDQREGDYEYEQEGDDGEYNYEEGENAEGEEEYVDDEDGDDFAKKIGVMFS